MKPIPQNECYRLGDLVVGEAAGECDIPPRAIDQLFTVRSQSVQYAVYDRDVLVFPNSSGKGSSAEEKRELLE
jgi:hypothetical protein